MAVLLISKSLNRVEKSLLVWPGTVSTRGFHCSRDWLYDFCVVG